MRASRWHVLIFKDEEFIARALSFKEAAECISASIDSVRQYSMCCRHESLQPSFRYSLKGYKLYRIPATAPLDISGIGLKLMYQNGVYR